MGRASRRNAVEPAIGGCAVNSYRDAMEMARRDVITAALLECAGNRSNAAKLLKITRTQLYLLIRALRIDVPRRKP